MIDPSSKRLISASKAVTSFPRRRTGRSRDPETLVAEMVAARLAGNRDRERTARHKLQSEFGVELLFADELEVPHAE
jgi:hypothetical protein